MQKKRLISGMGREFAERRKKVFRFLARHLEVQRVWTQIDSITPNQFAGRTNTNLLESERVAAQGEQTFANVFREVNDTGYAVVKLQF